MAGSINLAGAFLDDVVLKDYAESTDEDSGPVRIFAPRGSDTEQYAQFGFLLNGQKVADDTVWTSDGGTLSPGNPVTLTHDAGNGIELQMTFSIDENYMLTVEKAIANGSGTAAVVQPYGLVGRTSDTASADFFIAHSGPIGSFGQSVEYGNDYSDVEEAGSISPPGSPDWIGFTDIYWLAALVPQDGAAADGTFRSLGADTFRADMIYDPVTVPAGNRYTTTSRIFAGAKDSEILDAYQDAGIPQFGLAIDWGWFRWFEKPFLWLLNNIFEIVGNFGVAIIILTIIVRAVMFPIAQKQFASMAAMKAIQPKMKALQERYKDDKLKQQQEMQKLFREEKVNPLAGCLPLLLQIPIFFALYKVLYLAIEMRHQNFPVYQGSVRARSGDNPQPVRPAAVHAAQLPGHRYSGSAAGCDHVADLQAEPVGDGPDAAADFQHHALGPDVHHGAVCRGPAALLGNLQRADAGAAEISLFQASRPAGRGGEGEGGKSSRGTERQGGELMDEAERAAQEKLERRARKLFSGRVDFLLSAPQLQVPARTDGARNRLRRAIQCRQEFAAQCADRPQGHRARIGHAGPYAGIELLRGRRAYAVPAGRHARLRLCQGAGEGGRALEDPCAHLSCAGGRCWSATSCWSMRATG